MSKMKLGIKVGLQGDSATDLAKTRPDFCEVWFHSGKIDQYDNLFRSINRIGCRAGLHFWGILADGTQANLAYPDNKILQSSIKLVKVTIDYATKSGCFYVNVHPGEARLTKVDFEKEIAAPYTTAAPLQTCKQILGASLAELAGYAKKRGVELYVESIPKKAPSAPWLGTEGRKNPINLVQIPISLVMQLFNIDNLFFTNDLGHTAGNVISTNRNQIINFLSQITAKLAFKTKLLHVSYIVPPYNGTDYHGCIYYDEFNTTAAIPNRDEMKQLLRLFKERNDVGALVEPETDHVRNFQTLQNLAKEI